MNRLVRLLVCPSAWPATNMISFSGNRPGDASITVGEEHQRGYESWPRRAKISNLTLLNANSSFERIECATLDRPPLDLIVTGAEVKAMKARKVQRLAIGPDEIPANIFKASNDVTCKYIFDTFNRRGKCRMSLEKIAEVDTISSS